MTMGEIEQMSLLDVEIACEALSAWQEAGRKAEQP